MITLYQTEPKALAKKLVKINTLESPTEKRNLLVKNITNKRSEIKLSDFEYFADYENSLCYYDEVISFVEKILALDILNEEKEEFLV